MTKEQPDNRNSLPGIRAPGMRPGGGPASDNHPTDQLGERPQTVSRTCFPRKQRHALFSATVPVPHWVRRPIDLCTSQTPKAIREKIREFSKSQSVHMYVHTTIETE